MNMYDVLNILATFFCFAISLLAANLISSHKSFSFILHRKNRYRGIDGLRGFLTISVLFHHFIITWYWKVSGKWARPPEDYYQNYGRVSVAIFFMITGFLFISKILNDNGKTNWLELYESRIFRIYPLYLFALLLITVIVLISSNFELKISLVEIISQYARWLFFYGNLINNFPDTKIIIASVDWTLHYELAFYLSLPILSIVITRFNKIGAIFLFVLSVVLFLKPTISYSIDTSLILLFAIGGLSAYINRRYQIPVSIIKSNLVSILSLLIVGFTIFYPKTFDSLHLLLISLFFILVVLGNDLFGIFSLKSATLLGEISYSIYLLHGIVLYLAFSVFNIATIKNITLQEYLIFMPIICVVVVFISAVTFIIVEKPSMEFGRKHIFSQAVTSGIVNLQKILRSTR